MTVPDRGQVWWGEIERLGRRPFLVMSRPAAIPVLNSVLAAHITRTVRGIPTELPLRPDDGMSADCAASFDNLRAVSKTEPRRPYLHAPTGPPREACTALRTTVNC